MSKTALAFDSPGVYQYLCTIHPNMKATVTVAQCRRRFRDLRHIHTTLMLPEDVQPKVVAERLGYAVGTGSSDVRPAWRLLPIARRWLGCEH